MSFLFSLFSSTNSSVEINDTIVNEDNIGVNSNGDLNLKQVVDHNDIKSDSNIEQLDAFIDSEKLNNIISPNTISKDKYTFNNFTFVIKDGYKLRNGYAQTACCLINNKMYNEFDLDYIIVPIDSIKEVNVCHDGPIGATCSVGPRGPAGTVGPRGPTGTVGSIGAIGATGPTILFDTPKTGTGKTITTLNDGSIGSSDIYPYGLTGTTGSFTTVGNTCTIGNICTVGNTCTIGNSNIYTVGNTPKYVFLTNDAIVAEFKRLSDEIIKLNEKINNIKQGPAGPAGPIGEQGLQGLQGIKGNDGKDGITLPCPAVQQALQYKQIKKSVPKPKPQQVFNKDQNKPINLFSMIKFASRRRNKVKLA
jgi:hypothetical protein